LGTTALPLLVRFEPPEFEAGPGCARDGAECDAASTVHRYRSEASDLFIALIPDTVEVRGKEERIRYHAEIDIEQGDSTGIAWELQFFDDRGKPMSEVLESGRGRGKKSDKLITKPVSMSLTDGYYELRLRTAVSTSERWSALLGDCVYLEVKNGKWTELTGEEFLNLSRARTGELDRNGILGKP
jgi:hypothetical protein